MVDIEYIDEDKFVARVDELAEEAEDWRVHLPFGALLEIHKRDEVRAITARNLFRFLIRDKTVFRIVTFCRLP